MPIRRREEERPSVPAQLEAQLYCEHCRVNYANDPETQVALRNLALRFEVRLNADDHGVAHDGQGKEHLEVRAVHDGVQPPLVRLLSALLDHRPGLGDPLGQLHLHQLHLLGVVCATDLAHRLFAQVLGVKARGVDVGNAARRLASLNAVRRLAVRRLRLEGRRLALRLGGRRRAGQPAGHDARRRWREAEGALRRQLLQCPFLRRPLDR
mmetsp:Transcript_78880/g.241381  ORF Transcript_78880/g.241381 Transcript_78880/m.241381 type:complete len:210 (-) Transcript_78880:94-723(-)